VDSGRKMVQRNKTSVGDSWGNARPDCCVDSAPHSPRPVPITPDPALWYESHAPLSCASSANRPVAYIQPGIRLKTPAEIDVPTPADAEFECRKAAHSGTSIHPQTPPHAYESGKDYTQPARPSRPTEKRYRENAEKVRPVNANEFPADNDLMHPAVIEIWKPNDQSRSARLRDETLPRRHSLLTQADSILPGFPTLRRYRSRKSCLSLKAPLRRTNNAGFWKLNLLPAGFWRPPATANHKTAHPRLSQ